MRRASKDTGRLIGIIPYGLVLAVYNEKGFTILKTLISILKYIMKYP
jgi:hypothetical protein